MNNDVNGQYINNPLSARFDKKFATMPKCHCRKSTGDNNIICLRLANQSNVLNRPYKEKEQNNRYKPSLDTHIFQFRSNLDTSRPEERRVGKGCVRTCRSRGGREQKKKTK